MSLHKVYTPLPLIHHFPYQENTNERETESMSYSQALTMCISKSLSVRSIREERTQVRRKQDRLFRLALKMGLFPNPMTHALPNTLINISPSFIYSSTHSTIHLSVSIYEEITRLRGNRIDYLDRLCKCVYPEALTLV